MFDLEPIDVKFALLFLLAAVAISALSFGFGGSILTWYILRGLTG